MLLAAGQGLRAGGDVPKQYRLLAGKPLLRWSAESLLRHPRIHHVHVLVAEGEEAQAQAVLNGLAVSIGTGGNSRQQSVQRGLEQLGAVSPPTWVLIHDAARPLVPAALVDRVLAGLAEAPGASPALAVVDSLRRGDGFIETEVARDDLWRVQTPQGFDYALLRAAHAEAPEGATDDAEILRAAGHPVKLVPGDERTMKITHASDFDTAARLLPFISVTGFGHDVHRFGAGDHIFLCGVKIPHSHSLIGHSDADVGLHALTDAVLGAIGAGDIGQHFPPSDARWKGASSDRFLAHAAQMVAEMGGRILHCDLTIICEAPKVGPHRQAMLDSLAKILGAHAPRISIKATTSEGLGFTGRREGIAAQALATVRMPDWNGD